MRKLYHATVIAGDMYIQEIESRTESAEEMYSEADDGDLVLIADSKDRLERIAALLGYPVAQ